MSAVARHTGSTPSWGSPSYRVTKDNLFIVQGRTLEQGSFIYAGNLGKYRCSAAASEKVNQYVHLAPTQQPHVTVSISREQSKKESLKWLLSSSADSTAARHEADIDIRENTRASAVRFLDRLRDNQITPVLMPDGEGDVILYWGNPAVLLITVEETTLHLVLRPGQSDAQYFSPVSLEAGVPDWVIRKVPTIEHSALSSL